MCELWKCFLIAFFAMPVLAAPRLALDAPSVDFGEVAARAPGSDPCDTVVVIRFAEIMI